MKTNVLPQYRHSLTPGAELSEQALQFTAEAKDRRGKKKAGVRLHSAP